MFSVEDVLTYFHLENQQNVMLRLAVHVLVYCCFVLFVFVACRTSLVGIIEVNLNLNFFVCAIVFAQQEQREDQAERVEHGEPGASPAQGRNQR